MPAWPGGGGCCWVPLIPSPWLGVWYTLGRGWWIWVDRLGGYFLDLENKKGE